MYNFEDYVENKKALIEKIENTKASIAELGEIGIDVSESLKKLDKAIQKVSDDKLSIVLVGAFSDGKTSVVAGWINEKFDNMKISSDESSDEILSYTVASLPDYCRIVDTPGLFGDKKGSDDEGKIIALSDKTKKYISEANLILYVVTAKNPIKDTHKDCIRWIMKDLNMLSSTIFVINRMDDVADLTDEEDFLQQSKIKTENVRNKLLECGLSQSEASQAKIVCISADPDGQGIDKWNQHRDEYLRRSRISELENMTNSVLMNSRDRLIAKTGCGILNDEINKSLEIISAQEKIISEVLIPARSESLKRNQKDLESLHNRIMRNRIDMKKALKELNKSKISKIRAASVESFKDVMEDEIGIVPGKEGYVLNDDINTIFMEYSDKNSASVKAAAEGFQTEYEKQKNIVEDMIKQGVNHAARGLKNIPIGADVIKGGIFAGRDFLGKIGVANIKFKPWQVVKMASFAAKAIPIIGAAIDVVAGIVENVNAQRRSNKFEENKNNIKDAINDTFIEIYDELNSDEKYINDFAPEYKILEQQVKQDQKDIEKQKMYLQKFAEWEARFSNVDFVRERGLYNAGRCATAAQNKINKNIIPAQ